MKRIVLGTAGHIDHGKTSLVRALTGIDCDRLAEEKARGITIELGFAHLALPSGQRIGIVDVPGHEKFVKNMVAGATGIDVVALVIAADEGVMPQTREHLDICSLLAVKKGLVVLTKCDMVEEEWLEMVSDDIRTALVGTFLEDAPLVPVSSVTGAGLDELKAVLDDIVKDVAEAAGANIFRLPVDRVFTMHGFGTVVTGTLASGHAAVGDMVTLYPSGVRSKVRGLQVHNDSVTESFAGMRTAVNFQGLDKAAVKRGDVVAAPDTLKNSRMVDVWLSLLKTARPLKSRARVRFHTGSSEIMGKVVLFGCDELLPGQEAPAQMRLDEPVALIRDDRFVIRSYSPVHTIGGGRVLHPFPAKRKRGRPGTTESLIELSEAEGEALAELCVRLSDFGGISQAELAVATNFAGKKLKDSVEKLLSKKALVVVDKEARVFIHAETLARLEELALSALSAYHAANPLKTGMPKEELKSRLDDRIGPKTFHLLIASLSGSKKIEADQDLLRLAGYTVFLAEDEAAAEKKIRDAYEKGGLTPPYFKELTDGLGVSEKTARGILAHMVQENALVKVKEDLYFTRAALDDLKIRLVAHLKAQGELTPVQFKEMTNASRKYAIPLLEWFDSAKVTLRVGDVRRLRSG
ncbi:MAG: selenocysteine-specific translation elongation factor [Deltaproteobacteria bacterium]|nr:selenocysteine-specific translation elongation factor [Deltaproteobacteria bacterium]